MENKGDSMGSDSTVSGGAPSKKPIVEAVKDASSVKYVSEKIGVSRPTLYKYMEKYDAGDEVGPGEKKERLDAQKFFDFLQEADRTEEDVVLYFNRFDLDPDSRPSKTLEEVWEEDSQRQSEWYDVDSRLYDLGNDIADAVLGWQGSSEFMRGLAGRIREIDDELVNPPDWYRRWESEADQLVEAALNGQAQEALVAIAKRAQDAADRTRSDGQEEYYRLDEEHWELSNELVGDVLSAEGAPESLMDAAVRHKELNDKLLSLQESTPEEIREAEVAKMYYYKRNFFDKPVKSKPSEDVVPVGSKLSDPAVVSSSGRAMIMFPDVESEDAVARVLADFVGTRKSIAEYRPAPGTRFVTVEGLVPGVTFYCEVADPSTGESSGQVPFSL